MKNESVLFNWITIIFLPIIGVAAGFNNPVCLRTTCFAGAYYFVTGIAITAGYHRLWAHRSYQASLSLRILLAIAGAACCQWSIRTWAKCHRSHHRYTDTDQDPYSVKHGFWHAHIGWVLKPEIREGPIDLSDLDSDPVVRWQHKYYLPLAIITAFIFPSIFAGILWGDWWGGLIYAGIIRLFFCYQALFFVNSIAHYLGDQPYDDKHTPRNHLLVALLCFGEGYHNYHHEFPADYRNGVRWYQYDITKWCIWASHQLGLAHGLRRAPQNVVDKGVFQQKQKRIERIRSKLYWGLPISELPTIAWKDYDSAVVKGRDYIIISGMVYDIEPLLAVHPGGSKILRQHMGKDVTNMFNGGVYQHSNAARNWLDDFRIGVICGSSKKSD